MRPGNPLPVIRMKSATQYHRTTPLKYWNMTLPVSVFKPAISLDFFTGGHTLLDLTLSAGM